MILITGLNNNENPAPGIGVAKSLKEEKLIGLTYDVNDNGIYYDELFDKIYLMPFPTLGWKAIKEKLLEIINDNKEEKEIILIPTLDSEFPIYIKYKEELSKLGIKLLIPNKKVFDLRDKSKLKELSKKLKINYPETYNIYTSKELFEKVKEIGFPCMIKGNYYKAYKVNSEKELLEYFYEISNEWGFPVLIQKLVKGTEINYMGISKDGNLLSGIAVKKMTTTNIGKIWNGITIYNKELIEVAKKFCKLTNWSGAFEIEAISDGKNIYLIEINPRFPAWVNFGSLLGVNLPKIMINILRGKKVNINLDYPVNKIIIRTVEERLIDEEKFFNLLKNKKI